LGQCMSKQTSSPPVTRLALAGAKSRTQPDSVNKTRSNKDFPWDAALGGNRFPAIQPQQRMDEQTCASLLDAIELAPAGDAELRERVADLCTTLHERTFLYIDEIIIGGSVGKGLASRSSTPDADLLVLVAGLPTYDGERWLPHLLEALLSVLAKTLGGGIAGLRIVDGEHAEMVLLGDDAFSRPPTASDLHIRIFLIPAFDSRKAIGAGFGSDYPSGRRRQRLARASLPEAVELVASQPAQIKSAIKILKWWACQQIWSSTTTVPPPYLLELFVIISAAAAGPRASVAKLVEVALDLCANLPRQRITWEHTALVSFKPGDVDVAIQMQRPLVVDPTNPNINVADPGVFDGSELQKYAKMIEEGSPEASLPRPVWEHLQGAQRRPGGGGDMSDWLRSWTGGASSPASHGAMPSSKLGPDFRLDW